MAKYIVKRLLMMIPVLLGITLLIFGIMEISPSDPASIILGEGATEEAVEQLREEMGLNDPFFVRYFNYVKGVVQGDLGRSYRTGVPVFEEIVAKYPVTIKLAVFGILVSLCIGIPVGVISAVKQYSIIDGVGMFMTMLLTAMPKFWLGMLLMLIFSLKLDIFPATGAVGWMAFVLPVLTTGARSIANITRMTRATMLEVMAQDYIRTVRAKGASEMCVIMKHALRNAMIPVVTVAGVNFGHLMGGAVLIETVFAMPGLGTLMVTGIRTADIPIVMGTAIVIAAMFSLINLVVDIIYTFLDPQLKSQLK